MLSHGANKEQRRQGVDDAVQSVCEAALQSLSNNKEDLDEKAVLSLLQRGIDGGVLIDSAIQTHGEALIQLAKRAKGPTLKRLVNALKQTCQSVEDAQIKALLTSKQYIVVGRWLQGQRGDEIDALRWRLVREENIDVIERSRWIERLLGRCDEEELVDEAQAFSLENHPQLLLDAAQNLSTAFDNLEP